MLFSGAAALQFFYWQREQEAATKNVLCSGSISPEGIFDQLPLTQSEVHNTKQNENHKGGPKCTN